MAIDIASLVKRFEAHALAACMVMGSIVAASPAGRAQTLTTPYGFGSQGYQTETGPVQARDRNFYGTTGQSAPEGDGTIAKITPGRRLTALYDFCSLFDPETDACMDGVYPQAGLVQGTDGNFYGTTWWGGAFGAGTVFRITPGGRLTTLHSFDGTDGIYPVAGLVQASDGNFYGTIPESGPMNGGTVFRITPDGTLTTLYAFCSQGSLSTGCPDGDWPSAALVQGSDGNLYGTTLDGGANGPGALGTVFRVTPSGMLTTLYSFCAQSGCTDGRGPYAALLEAADGNFYGTTAAGGAYSAGTIFKITREGTLTTLYSFCSQSNCTDGQGPYAPMVQAPDGNFYGTTVGGGFWGDGTVFRISPEGWLTTLYSFCSQLDPQTGFCTDGNGPSGLVQGSDGNFYGTTEVSDFGMEIFWLGDFGGTVFKITPSGSLTTIYSFCLQPHVMCPDGNMPYAALVQGTDGTFYGTTYQGGANSVCFSGLGCGTVFTLSAGLGAFVEPRPNFGPVGEPVILLGNNLTRATSVSFNGTAARFSVVSSTEIKTSVPKGARTGKVQVTTPSETLTSNVPFRVTTGCAAPPCMQPMAP